MSYKSLGDLMDSIKTSGSTYKRPTPDEYEQIAIAAMTALEENGIDTFVLIKNDLVRDWWGKRKEAIRKAEETRVEKERMNRIREEALARLSDEEKIALGLTKPITKIKKRAVVEEDVGDYDKWDPNRSKEFFDFIERQEYHTLKK